MPSIKQVFYLIQNIIINIKIMNASLQLYSITLVSMRSRTTDENAWF